MKRFVIVGAVAATLLSLSAWAAAARPVRPNERWCLNVSEYRGGGHYRCDYATREQCMASRTANAEWCMLNPEIGFEQRPYYYYR